MKKQTETFEQILKKFEYKHDPRTVFDDFLKLSICALTQNPLTGKSQNEDLYLQTISKHKDAELRFEFPNLLATLINEMEDRLTSSLGNDVLGEYYEHHLYRKGASQYFTPYPICSFMVKSVIGESKQMNKEPIRVLDPCCGSGRMLLAAKAEAKSSYEFYGIDIDATCVKMATLNLFLNGMFNSEVMCADALIPEDFRFSYKISFLPLGIFLIEEKEKSLLWRLVKNSFENRQKRSVGSEIQFPSEMNEKPGDGKQLSFF